MILIRYRKDCGNEKDEAKTVLLYDRSSREASKIGKK